MLGNNKTVKYPRKGYARRRIDLSAYLPACAKTTLGVLIIAGLSMVCVFGYSVVTQCDYLKAKKVYVSGEKQLSKQEVLAQAKVTSGMNILFANLGVMRKRLLAHPDIISADVGRIFPDTLYINIKEQQPLAIVDFENKYVMNTQGDIYKKYSGTASTALPEVSGLLYSDFFQDTGKKPNPHLAVLQILTTDKKDLETHFGGPIDKIHVDRQMGITLFTKAPVRKIKLGYGDYRKKIADLNTVFDYMERTYQITAFRSVDMMKNDCVVLSPEMRKESDTKREEV